jgi:hypothetical protein
LTLSLANGLGGNQRVPLSVFDTLSGHLADAANSMPTESDDNPITGFDSL